MAGGRRQGGDTADVRRLARILDEAVAIPGTSFRIGLDALLGLVPGVGDIAGGLVSSYVLLTAARLGAPTSVLLRMFANLAIDAIVGSIPLLGDLFDAGWKANSRNVGLLETYLARPQRVRAASRAAVAGLMLLTLLLAAGGVALAIWLVRGVIALIT